MKKQKFMCLIGISIMILGIAACGKEEGSVDDGNTIVEETERESSAEKGKEEEKPTSDEKEEKEGNTIFVYYPDEETGKLISTQVEVSEVDAKEIWIELQKIKIVSENEKVLGIEIADDKSMTLDLNKEFGEHLRSVGTTEEKGIIESIANTYLEAFACEKIMLTEEGGQLYSGHKEYNTYIEKK